MNRLARGALAVAGGAVALEAARRFISAGNGHRYQPWERAPYKDFPNKVLIVGGGFAGYNAAEKLCRLARGRDDVGVMLVSRENYFTFWPMLASVVGGDVQTRNVAQPLRRTLIRLGSSFRRAELEGVDTERRVVTAGGKEFPYDHLILSLGAEPAYFGIPGVEEHCISIRGIGAGERIVDRVIERYEEKESRLGAMLVNRYFFTPTPIAGPPLENHKLSCGFSCLWQVCPRLCCQLQNPPPAHRPPRWVMPPPWRCRPARRRTRQRP